MSRFPQIAPLFASLASNLQTPDQAAVNEVDYSISNLSHSLNLSEVPRTRVLDAALSLMCFTAPQVYDSSIEYTVRTIVTVLTSSIECKVLRVNKDQVLRVGGSMSHSDVASVMEWCVDTFGKLGGYKGDLFDLLLYCVIRVAVLAPSLHRAISSRSNHDAKFAYDSVSSHVKTLFHLPNETNIRNGKIPLRLLIWHLDPMILKQDMSEILQEVTERPFLSLSKEFYERIDWRSKITCLVMSPSIFVNTRALLHNWFLVTGLASILELQTALVVQVMDIISRPMAWGLSMEVGSKLPFSHAYFPYDHQWLRTLSGPISQEYFLHLLNLLNVSISHTGRRVQISSKKISKYVTTIDHKSKWSMAMNFPGWFSFASLLLFYDNGSDKPRLLNGVELPCSVGAARYIAWIMNPMNKSHQDLLVDYLIKVSELWTLKRSSLKKSNQVTEGGIKETSGQSGTTSHGLDSKTIWLWLKEFKDMYIRYFETKDGLSTSRIEGFDTRCNIFLQRIPIGFLIGYLNHLTKDGCALLLHYAAIGTIEKFPEKQVFEQNRTRWKYGCQSAEWSEEYTRAEAVSGCRLVFDITNVSESISPAMFESEEDELNFMCQLKLKTGDYLLKCIKRLIELKFDKDQMQRDLLTRIIHWRNQGRDIYQDNKEFDILCDSLN